MPCDGGCQGCSISRLQSCIHPSLADPASPGPTAASAMPALTETLLATRYQTQAPLPWDMSPCSNYYLWGRFGSPFGLPHPPHLTLDLCAHLGCPSLTAWCQARLPWPSSAPQSPNARPTKTLTLTWARDEQQGNGAQNTLELREGVQVSETWGSFSKRSPESWEGPSYKQFSGNDKKPIDSRKDHSCSWNRLPHMLIYY